MLIQAALGIKVRVSIHAFRGEGDLRNRLHQQSSSVSIHAFRGEGDNGEVFLPRYDPVSIHAFRGEGDESVGYAALKSRKFQSTPSGGKAT